VHCRESCTCTLTPDDGRAPTAQSAPGSFGLRETWSAANPFVQSMAGNFEEALRLMEAALTDCPDDLWETDLCPDEAPTSPTPHGGLHGSAPWFLASDAPLTLDDDPTAEFEPWEPPKPFDENTSAFADRVFTKAELLGYVDFCRGRARQTRDAPTEAAGIKVQPVPGDRGNTE
jgi:hypothetical protein